jgi:hypothetical protein
MIQGKLNDDRPPSSPNFYAELNEKAAEIIGRHADKNPRHYTISDTVELRSVTLYLDEQAR